MYEYLVLVSTYRCTTTNNNISAKFMPVSVKGARAPKNDDPCRSQSQQDIFDESIATPTQPRTVVVDRNSLQHHWYISEYRRDRVGGVVCVLLSNCCWATTKHSVLAAAAGFYVPPRLRSRSSSRTYIHPTIIYIWSKQQNHCIQGDSKL